MPYETDDYLARHVQTSAIDLQKHVDELLHQAVPADSANFDLYREMLSTVIRMAQADRDRWTPRSCCKPCARWKAPSPCWRSSNAAAK